MERIEKRGVIVAKLIRLSGGTWDLIALGIGCDGNNARASETTRAIQDHSNSDGTRESRIEETKVEYDNTEIDYEESSSDEEDDSLFDKL